MTLTDNHPQVTPPRSSLTQDVLDDLHRRSGADRWGVSRDEFAVVVNRSIERAFDRSPPSERELRRYVSRLHVADLALACACALGREPAWDHFVIEHRPILYRSADALDPAGGARELADGLYADLYGTSDAPDRRSLFRYFHGRSSLATWLRAVMSQRHVDAMRARRRLEPLPEVEGGTRIATPSADPDRPRLVRLVVAALQTAVDALPPKDRLRLRSYYVLQLTLAQIGRLTGEHEATISRQLSRTRRALRDAMEQHLRETGQLTTAQVSRAVELALEDPGSLDLESAFDTSSQRKKLPPDRST
jgi:RNA polymerase sigma-70 factor, ECF subfamily